MGGKKFNKEKKQTIRSTNQQVDHFCNDEKELIHSDIIKKLDKNNTDR